MFYDLQLLTLREQGKFAKCWLAATLRHRSKLTRSEVISTNIPQTCDEIMKYVNSRSGNPRKRFSLYLAATLIYGIIVIYDQQVNIFQNAVFYYLSQGLYLRKRGLKVDKKPRKTGKKRFVFKDQEVAALQNVSDKILADAATVVGILEQIIPADNATITMREDPRPFIQPLPYEGGFGDEDNIGTQLGTMEEVITGLNGQSPRMQHPTMQVVADVHPIPSNINLSTITDAVPLTPRHRKRLHTTNDSESSPRKVRRTLFQGDLNVISSENGRKVDEELPLAVSLEQPTSAPPYMSTPILPEQQKKQPAKEVIDNIILQSLLDIKPISGPDTKNKRRKKLTFVDLQTIIPRADMLYIRGDPTTLTTQFKCANPKPGRACKELFVRPARNIICVEILSRFRYEVSARTHSLVEPSMGPSLTPGGSLTAIPDISDVPPEVVPTESMDPILEPAPALATSGVDLQRPTSLSNQNIIDVIEPPPVQSPLEINLNPTPATPAVEFLSSTKLARMKRDIRESMKNHWRIGDRDISFYTLCPPTTTSRILAAVTFSFLLELEAKKYIRIITMPNSTAIYKIRKVNT